MAKTYVNILKKDAVINVPFTPADIARLQSILLKHLDKSVTLDDASWQTIEELCQRVDDHAREQNQTESKEVNF
jgi:hypothetical protein